MVKRAMILLVAALALLLAGCTVQAKPTVEELRKEYPLYQEDPLVDGIMGTFEEYVQRAPIGALATIVDGPEDVVLKNRGADGQQAIATLEPLEVRYVRYTLRVDTVIFGENPGGEIALYLPKAMHVPLQAIDTRVGNRFFYGLARYAQDKQKQLDTLLACNSIQERLPIYLGGAMMYWTKQGYMLSARPGPDDPEYDLMTKQEFIRAIRSLRDNATPQPAATP